MRALAAAAALLPVLLAFLPSAGAQDADDAVFSAMRSEMDRSLRRLALEGSGPPYHLLYRLTDRRTRTLSATLGALTDERSEDSRTLYVEARVGSPALDNTTLGARGQSSPVPMDASAMRQALWLLTDEAYKSALAGFLEKKARKAVERDLEEAADFSTEEPLRRREPSPPPEDIGPWKEYVRALSAELEAHADIYGSNISLHLPWSRRFLLTSEGTEIASPRENMPVRLMVSGWTRSEDGMLLSSGRTWQSTSTAALPPLEEAKRELRGWALDLLADRTAPLQEPVSLPTLIDPEMAGVLFHEALGHKLEGQRQRDPDQSHLFRGRVGERILPGFLSLIDDPTLADFNGIPTHGHYLHDDEGVAARRVILVERGVLKGFLMSRWPIPGFPRSNGHGRSEPDEHPSGRMSNLILEAHERRPLPELKKRLMELCRKKGLPYGLRLLGSGGGENPTGRGAAQTLEVKPKRLFRVDARTGEETPARGVKLVGTPLVLLNRVVAAGDDAAIFNQYLCNAESGWVPVSQIAPSLLLSEAEFQRLPEKRARRPILPSPLHDDGP